MNEIERTRMLELFENKKADIYPLDESRLNYIG